MSSNSQYVVLGAGPLGVSLSNLLTEQGHKVQLYSIMGNPAYDMPGTHPQSIDGASVQQVSEVCQGAEVVFLCLNAHYVDWYALFPPRLEAAIEAVATVGAKFVYHDTVYVYGEVDRPFTEDMPYTSKIRKGELRGDMAMKVLNTAKSGRIRAVIGRSADMYGSGALNSSFNSTLGQRHLYPLLEGKAVSILGDINQPHTYAFVDDVARGLITLAEHEDALGQVWHIPAAPTLSHKELMTLAFEEAGLTPRVNGSKISGYFVRVIGRFQKDVGEVSELLYQFERPLVVSHDKFEQAFGANFTSHREALRQTLEWYRRNPLQ